MGPVLLLLLLAAENSEFAATPPEHSTGLKFLVVFPENIAYYHPELPQNMVQITALYDGTSFTIKQHIFNSIDYILNKGESKNYMLDARMETQNTESTEKIVQINSESLITVQAINLRNNSVQTALVLPIDKLVTEYFIPPVPEIQGTTRPTINVTTKVTERAPFKLIIVNGEHGNEVTIKGKREQKIQLDSNKMAQIWVEEEEHLQSVKARSPVAVLFGHTCAIRHNCTCGQLYAMLPPAKEETLKFYIPPFLANKTKGFVLLSKKTTSEIIPFNPNSPLVETAGTAIFYHRGLLLTLIPEKDFATCYVVHTIPDTQSFVLIVVDNQFSDGVHVGRLPLTNPEWQRLENTDYVSTSVNLTEGKSVIWHASFKMAVYFMGRKDTAWFGNPAAIISTTPDFRGCVLTPEVVKIGDVADGWRESLKYCKDQNMELISFPEAQLQKQIHGKLLQANKDSLQEVWIGMRRSSQSGEWYWLNGVPVNDTNWEEGEPGTVDDGQCVIMSLEKNKDIGWSDKDCCEAAHPVCYTEPILFPF